MLQDLKECRFRDVPVGGLFVEVLETGPPIDFDDTHDVYEKCSDHDISLVGSIIEGTVYLKGEAGDPTPDHINGFSRVMYVSRERVMQRVA